MAVRDLLEKAEQYTVEIINGRKKNTYDRLYRLFLYFLSHLYRYAVEIRLSMYKHSFLKRQNLGSFVVSVGNLTTGGTGKTPVVELLAKELAKRGRKVAILSRGYRSKSPTWREKLSRLFGNKNVKRTPKVVSDGNELKITDSLIAGDEPFMLARNLLKTEERNGVAVVVDKDRVLGGRYAIDHFNSDTLLLDDGFQYMPLRPRINIVLVDSTCPFHNHETLPVGLLREPIEHIKEADYIFITKSKGQPCLSHLKDFLRRHVRHDKIIECNHEPTHLQNLWSQECKELNALQGKKVAAICGIAVPECFEKYLEDLGATIVYRERYVDHHRYRTSEIQSFCDKAIANGAEMMLTTEKDAVRIPKVNTHGRDFDFLRVEILIRSGEDKFQDCLKKICMK